ncbi:MAG: aminotransferase class III-fold pyridoxal phosphate-dependent enzyme [Proteobacteria bacterium]|nr:aminotransferase class III-fold pyridoxal phosphate-dependent enzyme [Pseudomonadota bacterium]
MPDTAPNSPGLTNSEIVAAYREKTPGSAKLAEEARGLFPSGITHDGRHFWPYGPYVTHADGPRKWDVDGNEYVDYFGGHGSHLLGHNHPVLQKAIHEAQDKGTHFGANNPYEIRWGNLIREMVPSAERVRFTSSGTEATHMALRLARAYTGKTRMIRFMRHFHGWHDHMASGYHSHFDGTATPGVLSAVAEEVILVAPNDEAGLTKALTDHDDVAAIFVEPTGSNFGMVPIRPEYLKFLRDAATKHGVVLIFDEVVTGFRVSPGGAQAHYGVIPDMTTLAKILSGTMPGGAVVGRKDILDLLDFEVAAEKGFEKVEHFGTYNANPVAAAAGSAMLETIRDTDACAKANAYAERLRAGLNDAIREAGVRWAAYGTFSGAHIFTNPKGRADVSPDSFDPMATPMDELAANAPCVGKLRIALLTHGVDFNGWPGGQTSAAHGDPELRDTLAAFAKSLHLLKKEGEL